MAKGRGAQFFISYAREDKAFALKVRSGLAAEGRIAWLDTRNIAALALWKREIAAAIDAADVFVFVISPDSVKSSACLDELRIAVEARKRLAPLVWRNTDDALVPSALRAPNWIFAGDANRVDILVGRLLKAADTDQDWVKDHSRLLTRAREWMQHRRDPSRLLVGQGLQDALKWLAESAQRGDRPVSKLHGKYIEASQAADAAATARQRELYLKALARQLAAQSELARGTADVAIETPALLAMESLLRWPTVEGDRAMRRSLRLVPRPALASINHPRRASVFMSHDGTTLAVVTRTSLRLVDIRTGRNRWRVPLKVKPERVSFGAGESTIVVRSTEGVVHVYRRRDGKQIGRCVLGVGIEDVVVDADGTGIAALFLGGGRQKRIEVWSFAEPSKAAFTVEPEADVNCLALLYESRVLVAVIGASSPNGHTRVTAWDNTGATSVLWELYGRPVSAAIAHDGEWVALAMISFGAGGSSDVSVGSLAGRLANPDAFEKMGKLGHDAAVSHIEADAAGRLLSWTHEGSMVHVWEPSISRLIARFKVAGQGYRASLAADEQTLVVAHRPKSALRSGGHVSLIGIDGTPGFSTAADAMVEQLACDREGRVAVSTEKRTTVWDSDTASHVRAVVADPIKSVCFSADSKRLLVHAPDDGMIVVPTGTDGHIIALKQEGSVWTAGFVGHQSKQVVTVGNPSIIATTPRGDSDIRLWDIARARVLVKRRRESHAPIALSPDGLRFATVFPEHPAVVVVKHTTSGRVLRRLSGAGDVQAMVFDATGTHIAILDKSEQVGIWQLAEGRRVATLEVRAQELTKLEIARGQALVTYYDSYSPRGTLIDLETSRTLVKELPARCVSLEFGLLAEATGESEFEVRPLRGKRTIKKLFHEYVHDLELSKAGTHLVSSGADGSARAWELSTATELARLEHPDRVLSTCISPDSRFIATTCSDDRIRVWTWRAEDLVAEGRHRISRRLTAAELDSYLPDRETRRQ